MSMRLVWLVTAVLGALVSPALAQNDIKVLATNKTSTLEKEMNEAAEAGYRFAAVMGGDTSFGGSEAVVIMTRLDGARPMFAYRLLAANKTGTMQKELQEAGDAGYEYRGQTSFKSTFGGQGGRRASRTRQLCGEEGTLRIQAPCDEEDLDDAEGAGGSGRGGLSVRRHDRVRHADGRL
jgi:hypothetical protein